MIFGMIRINNNSPIVDVEVPELLRPKSTITFVTNSVKSMLDKNGSTHTCRLQTDGRIVALGNSHQDNGIFLYHMVFKLDNLQENKILETIKISYGTDSYADVIKTGNQIWLYIRFYSETGQVTIPQNTKLFKLKDEYILGIKFNKYTPLVFPVYEREISNDMFLFSIVSGYVQPNTQFSFAGNTHCGFVRLI